MPNASYLLEYAFIEIKQRMPSLSTIEQKSFSLLKIILILLTITFIINVIFWLFNEEEGISVQPFETVGIKENFDGKPLATLLSFDLQKIKNIYESGSKATVIPKNNSRIIPRPLGDFCVPPPSMKNIPLEYSISQIGTLGVEGTSISIGNLLLSMKEFLGNKANTITCSLQRYNSTTTVVAILEDHHSSQNSIMTFEETAIISNDEEIPSLINNLAFKISLALSKTGAQAQEDTRYPQKWQTFKYLTQGRDAYNSYMVTKDPKDLDRGKNMALLANISEPDYNGTFELLSGLGFAYLQSEKYNEAANIFGNITKFKPFESELGLGLAYGNLGDFPRALNAFEKATQLDSHDPDAWNNKGVILIKQRNYVEAVKAFNRAIELDPQYAIAWQYKGNALANLGKISHSKYKYEEAVQAYNRATELNPKYASAWYNKGSALLLLGKNEDAIKAYNKVLQIDPSNNNALINKAKALTGLDKHDNKSVNVYYRALEITNRTLEKNPNNGGLWYTKGLFLYYIGNLEEAARAIDNANVKDPKNEEAWKLKAFLGKALHSYNESIEACNRALQINPNDAQILSFKEDILKSLDQNADAEAAFAKAKTTGM